MARGRRTGGLTLFRVLRVLPNERTTVIGYVGAVDYVSARILAREQYQGALRIEVA